MHERLLNVLVVAACAAVFLIYIAFVTSHIAPGISRIVTTISVLVALGLLSGLSMRGGLLAKLGFLIVVPILHIAYEGIDPAKPTLNLLVGAIELGCIWLGAAVGHLVRRRQSSSQAAAR